MPLAAPEAAIEPRRLDPTGAVVAPGAAEVERRTLRKGGAETVAYSRRVLDAELDELMTAVPALAIEGAKGVGKTATATRRARVVFALDDPARREVVAAD